MPFSALEGSKSWANDPFAHQYVLAYRTHPRTSKTHTNSPRSESAKNVKVGEGFGRVKLMNNALFMVY